MCIFIKEYFASRLTSEMLLPETRTNSPVDGDKKRSSTGSTSSMAARTAQQLLVKQLAAAILQVGSKIIIDLQLFRYFKDPP